MRRVIQPPKYRQDDIRRVIKFAWFPKSVNCQGITYRVWLEDYISTQRYDYWNDPTSGGEGMRWNEIDRHLLR